MGPTVMRHVHAIRYSWLMLALAAASTGACYDVLGAQLIAGRTVAETLPTCRVDTTLSLSGLPSTIQVSTVLSGAGQFPVAIHTDSGLAVVFRGRGGHFAIDGRLDLSTSRDGGRTWPDRYVVADSQPDRRNPALGADAGRLLLAYTVYDAYDSTGGWESAIARATTFYKRSDDFGRTWSAPAPLDVRPFEWSSPFGQIVAAGSELLMAGYGGYLPMYSSAGKSPAQDGFFSFLVRSRDGGATWSSPEVIARGHNETALAALGPDTVVAAVRNNDGNLLDIARWTRSSGRWAMICTATGLKEAPGDLTVLPGRRLLLTYGHRLAPQGIRARLSNDGGVTWSAPVELTADGATEDMGYPSTVLLGDSLLTAYYVAGGAAGTQLRVMRYSAPAP